VLEGQHLVSSGFHPPEFDELAYSLGLCVCQVLRLREVLVEVEERPAVGVEVVTAWNERAFDGELIPHVIGRRLPTRVVDRPAPHHLEVLGAARRLCCRVKKAREQARTIDRLLCNAVDRPGCFNAHGVEHGRQEIDRMTELRSHSTAAVEAPRPVHDQWCAYATEPCEALPKPKRRVPRPGPAPGVVVVCPESAELVEAPCGLGHLVAQVLNEAVLIEQAR